MSAWYNENDPFAAQWLRNLIAGGLIAEGEVDERSIVDVRPSDLEGYDQCHFFAGIGGWPLALRLAGWPDDRPAWTGSCPCQPLSGAGQRKGHADQRHLWPAFHRLIAERRPATVFGEQVAGKDGREWLAAVRADLEGNGYAVGAADLCAAGIGAPHIRQRLWWVAQRLADAGCECDELGRDARNLGRSPSEEQGQAREREWRRDANRDGGATGSLADADDARLEGHQSRRHDSRPQGRQETDGHTGATGVAGGLADAEHAERWPLDVDRQDGHNGQDGGRQEAYGEPGTRSEVRRLADAGRERHDGQPVRLQPGQPRQAGTEATGSGETGGLADAAEQGRDAGRVRDANWRTTTQSGRLRASCEGPRPADGFWRDADWLLCRDGKWRPVEPSTFPLASGVSVRVGRLRGYGNAIVPQLGAAFVAAFMETCV